MTNITNNNPIVRALVVIIIGTIAFGLLFDLFITGGGSMMDNGHMGSIAGGYGYSLDGFLAGLLVLLIKLLMVVLVLAVIFGIVIWVKNNLLTNTKIFETINNDPIVKTVSVITLAILGIILITGLLGSFSSPGMGYGGYGMGGHGGYGGFSATLSIAGLLMLLTKVLSYVLVISLILALAAYLKKQYEMGNLNFSKPNNPGNSNLKDTSGMIITSDEEFEKR